VIPEDDDDEPELVLFSMVEVIIVVPRMRTAKTPKGTHACSTTLELGMFLGMMLPQKLTPRSVSFI
jgi:hypothetical protein